MTSDNAAVKALIAELRDTDLPFDLRRRTTAALDSLVRAQELSARYQCHPVVLDALFGLDDDAPAPA